MANYVEALIKNPMVVYPSLSGKISFDPSSLLITLVGATNGIFVNKTWHHTMLGYLSYFGYNGKVYIPSRLQADDLADCEPIQVAQEQISNKKAIAQSNLVIYWGTDLEYVGDIAELLDLVWNSAAIKATGTRFSRYLFGAQEDSNRYKDLQGISGHVRLYSQMSQLASDAVESVKTWSK
jgi:hypothetical protein